MRKVLILVIYSLSIVQLVHAGEDSLQLEPLFEKGNQAYINQQYDSSILFYQKILDRDVHSSELYFNMGNAHFKLNDIPSAILFFEKAKKFAPGDKNILNNLAMANLKTVDRVESKPELAFETWWNSFLNYQNSDGWGKWTVMFGFVLLLLLIVYLVSSGLMKKVTFFAAAFALMLMLSSWIMASVTSAYVENNEYAIIFSPSVTVKSAPNMQANKLFVIHEGTKVKIEDSLDEWKKISLMNGNSGWIRDEALKLI